MFAWMAKLVRGLQKIQGTSTTYTLRLTCTGVMLITSPSAMAALTLPRDVEPPTSDKLKAKLSESRFALVIGIGNYSGKNNLKNTINDATAVAQALREIGYEVELGLDLDRGSLVEKLHEFEERGNARSVNIVYFAGHGFELAGENYIVPSGAKLQMADHVADEAIALSRIREIAYSTGAMSNVIILDSCRDHVFPLRDKTGTSRSSMVRGGFSEVSRVTGVFIAYATSPGSVAADGAGEHSPYTEQLIRHITKPGVFIEYAFKDIKREVMKQTGNSQIPWDLNSLTNDLELAPAITALDQEFKTWYHAKKLRVLLFVAAYVDAYPNGMYIKEAKALLKELQEEANLNVVTYSQPRDAFILANNPMKSYFLNPGSSSYRTRIDSPPPLTWEHARAKKLRDSQTLYEDLQYIEADTHNDAVILGITGRMPASEKQKRLQSERDALSMSIEKYLSVMGMLPTGKHVEFKRLEFLSIAGDAPYVEISIDKASPLSSPAKEMLSKEKVR